MTSVIVLIPIKPAMNPILKERITAIAASLPEANPTLRMTVVIDPTPEPSQPDDCRPWSKVARVRNKLLDCVAWREHDYVMWIDADVVELELDLPTRLIAVAGGGVAAPLVLVEGSERFYDWAAFVEDGKSVIDPTNRWSLRGRNLQHAPPYWTSDPGEDVVPLDCVGTVYVVHTDIYRSGVRHADHEAFTDHFPICAAARAMGRPVVCDRRLRVAHADLPKYGEDWH